MLNPKHIRSLKRCLVLVLGPHEGDNVTDKIQEGEEELKRLRKLE